MDRSQYLKEFKEEINNLFKVPIAFMDVKYLHIGLSNMTENELIQLKEVFNKMGEIKKMVVVQEHLNKMRSNKSAITRNIEGQENLLQKNFGLAGNRLN